jgi:transposase
MVIKKEIKMAVLRSINTIDNKKIIKIFGISKQSIYNWDKNKNNITEKYKNTQSKYTAEIKCFIRQYVISKVNFDMKKLMRSIDASRLFQWQSHDASHQNKNKVWHYYKKIKHL